MKATDQLRSATEFEATQEWKQRPVSIGMLRRARVIFVGVVAKAFAARAMMQRGRGIGSHFVALRHFDTHIEGEKVLLCNQLQLLPSGVSKVDVQSCQQALEDVARNDKGISCRHRCFIAFNNKYIIQSNCGSIKITFYIFNVCQLHRTTCSLAEKGIGAP